MVNIADVYLCLLFFVSTQKVYLLRPFIIKQNTIGIVLVSETQQKNVHIICCLSHEGLQINHQCLLTLLWIIRVPMFR